MRINWKDLFIALVIGLCVGFLGTFAVMALGAALQTLALRSMFFRLFFLSMIIAVSLGFYLWRNKSSWADTAIISFIYGFILPFFAMLFFLVVVIIEGIGGFDVFSQIYRLDTATILASVVLIACGNGLLAAILGCIVKYAIEPRDTHQKPKVRTKETAHIDVLLNR